MGYESTKVNYNGWYDVSVTATEQGKTFGQLAERVSIANDGAGDVLIAFDTANADATTTTSGKVIMLKNGESFDDDLRAKNIRYKTVTGTSSIRIYASW